MDSYNNLNLRTSKLKRQPLPGSVPGTFFIPEDALKPQITVYSYTKEQYRVDPVESFEQLKKHLEENDQMQHWVEVKGIGDREWIEALGDYFSIHRLELADVVNVYQRPKYEEHPEHLYIVTRMVYQNSDGDMFNEQISLFLGKNFLLSFQERYDDQLAPVRDRLITGKGFLRSMKVDYLAYAIVDAVLDNYFPLLEKMGNYLDDLEEELITQTPKKQMMFEIQRAKREIITIRRTAMQNKDMINDMMRSSSPFIGNDAKFFLRDAFDHNMQVMDIVDNYREATLSLLEIYLSSTNIRMNEIMKVLAVISTLFIPLTFIVGLYGMNFQPNNPPKDGHNLPWNMPELYSPYGYIEVCAFMAALFVGFLIYFRWRGWLTSDKSNVE